MNKKQLINVAAIAFASLASASSALASVIVTFDSVVPNPGPGGGFLWSYKANLQPDFNLRANNGNRTTPHDFFTIYDIIGLQAGSASFTPASPYTVGDGWTFGTTEQVSGFTPPKIGVSELSVLMNISVSLLSGPGAGVITPNPTGAAVFLGTVTFLDDYGAVTQNFDGQFTSLTQKKTNLTSFSTIGQLPLPTDPNSEVPEPAHAGLLFAGAAALIRRNRR